MRWKNHTLTHWILVSVYSVHSSQISIIRKTSPILPLGHHPPPFPTNSHSFLCCVWIVISARSTKTCNVYVIVKTKEIDMNCTVSVLAFKMCVCAEHEILYFTCNISTHRCCWFPESILVWRSWVIFNDNTPGCNSHHFLLFTYMCKGTAVYSSYTVSINRSFLVLLTFKKTHSSCT